MRVCFVSLSRFYTWMSSMCLQVTSVWPRNLHWASSLDDVWHGFSWPWPLEVLMVSFLSGRTVPGHVLLFFNCACQVPPCLPRFGRWRISSCSLQQQSIIWLASRTVQMQICGIIKILAMRFVASCLLHRSTLCLVVLKSWNSVWNLPQGYRKWNSPTWNKQESSRLNQTFYDAINSSPSLDAPWNYQNDRQEMKSRREGKFTQFHFANLVRSGSRNEFFYNCKTPPSQTLCFSVTLLSVM